MIKKLILKYIAGSLDGYKTIIGGLGMLALGSVYVVAYMFPNENLPAGDVEKGFTLITLGFTALGIGGKLEKLKKETLISKVSKVSG